MGAVPSEGLALTGMFLQPSTAPGRDTNTTAPAQPPPSGPAPAGGDTQAPGLGGMTILLLAAPLLLVFLMSRNQTKKQKQVESNLKVGDRVVTRSGLLGRILELGDRTAKLEIAAGVNVQILKTAIEGVDTPPEAKVTETKDKDSKDFKIKTESKDKDEKKDGVKDKAEEKKN